MSDSGLGPKRSSKLGLAVVFTPILLIGGCTAMLMFPWKGFAPSSAPAAHSAPSKYTQTWPKEYKATTCGEWLGKMTESQRWAASADVLTSARNKISGGSGLPSDALVTLFETNINTGCEGSSSVTILEAAYFIYNYDNTFKP